MEEFEELETETKTATAALPVALWKALRLKAMSDDLTVPQAIEAAVSLWVGRVA